MRILLAALFLMLCGRMSATTDYGLADNIQDGVILHCFDWPYSDIIDELENIANAGFTTVQTSPAQVGAGSYTWYWLYQPLGFYLSENELGTPDELEELCTKAHELGMFVIVDVVANHLAGDHTNIQDDLKDDQYWHTYGDDIDYSNRYAVTHGNIGMQDLATENSYVQQCVLGYIQDLADVGVDGIRWDAAKHIGLPSETDNSAFWPTVTTNSGLDLYNYGEILDGPSSSSSDDYLMEEYTTYMSVTDNTYGNGVRESFASSTAPTGYANWTTTDYVADDKVVYWAESHDTYSNDGGDSKYDDVNVIDRAWAVVASRNNATALYLSRPSATDNSSICIGKGSTHFTADEVAAVNHFHNACIGEADYFTSEDNVVSICRASGAVIVLGSGSNQSVSVANGGGYTAAGTYTDEISGNTFTVTETTITGTVGSTGIAVIYNDERPSMTLDPDGGSFTDDEITVTATLKNADSGTIKVGSDGETTSFTSSTTVTFGSDMEYGESVTLYWTATNSAATVEGSETYTKRDPNATITVYVQASSAPYIYSWDDDNNEYNGSWPGEQMSSTKEVNGTTYYYETYAEATSINVILNDGGSNQTDDITDIEEDIYLYYNGSTSYSVLDVEASDDSESTDDDSTNDESDDADSSDDSADSDGSGITIYVNASSAPYIYAWTSVNGTTTEYSGAWPGTQLSSTTTVDGTSFYYVTYDVESINIIFNDGNGNQTDDITDITEDTYFYYNGSTSYSILTVDASGDSNSDDDDDESSDDSESSDEVYDVEDGDIYAFFINTPGWSSVYCYAWASGSTATEYAGSWPGTECTKTEYDRDGYDVWLWKYDGELTEAPDYIIFNMGSNSAQTADLTFVNGAFYNYNGATGEVYTPSSESTGINTLSVTAADNNSNAVYSISGQYVGTTTENLPKGIYITNGKKIMVK